MYDYRPQTKVWGKVIFLHVCVILSTGGHTWLLGGRCVVAGGACMVAGGCVGYDEIRSMSGRYASYWNEFLFSVIFAITAC